MSDRLPPLKFQQNKIGPRCSCYLPGRLGLQYRRWLTFGSGETRQSCHGFAEAHVAGKQIVFEHRQCVLRTGGQTPENRASDQGPA